MAVLETDAEFVQTGVGEILTNLEIDWTGIREKLEEIVRGNGSYLFDRVITVTGSFISWIVDLVLGIVFAIYILGGKERLKGQATEAVILGPLCMIGMLILRIPYAGMIGALVGVTALLPIVGTYIGAIVGVILIVTKSPFKALVFLIFLIILQQLENHLIYPRVVGHKVQLPAIWVLAAITVGGNIGGPICMFLGIPVASSIYTLLKEATKAQEERRNSIKGEGTAYM